tara:strand:- start:3714 stop:4538 length:825 start_codon:yes stop_codon:yes gene_type:complete
MGRKKKEGLGVKLLKGGGKLAWSSLKLGAKGVSYVSRKGYESYKKSKEDAGERELDSRRSSGRKYEKFSEVKNVSGDLGGFENLLEKSSVGLVVGGAGQGKTAVSMKILENVYAKTGRKVMALGFKKEDMPSWVSVIDGLDDIEHGAFVVVDEGGIVLGSRSSMSKVNKLFSELLFIRRHKDITLLFIVQNSGNIDVNVVKQADYLVFKNFALLQGKMERKVVMDVYDEVKEDYSELFNEHGQGLTYIYSEAFRGFVNSPLPSFWSEKVSKGFR